MCFGSKFDLQILDEYLVRNECSWCHTSVLCHQCHLLESISRFFMHTSTAWFIHSPQSLKWVCGKRWLRMCLYVKHMVPNRTAGEGQLSTDGRGLKRTVCLHMAGGRVQATARPCWPCRFARLYLYYAIWAFTRLIMSCKLHNHSPVMALLLVCLCMENACKTKIKVVSSPCIHAEGAWRRHYAGYEIVAVREGVPF